MKFFDEAFHQAYFQCLSEQEISELSEEELSEIAEKTCNNMSDEVAIGMADDIIQGAKETLKEQRKFERAFIARNVKRWRQAFDLLETHIEVNQEVAELFQKEYFDELFEITPHKIQALSLLQARGLLVAREALSLLKSGYADGALTRWRSLHELAVVAQLLSHHEDLIAKRYLLGFQVQSAKYMREYQDYHQRAGLAPYSDQELSESEDIATEIQKEYGNEMRHKYGWAFPVTQKKNPSLLDLEKATDLDHMRPYFSWASHTLHASFKPPQTFLGACEIPMDREPALLAGASNSGLTDPIGLVAISLQQATGALLLLKENIGSIIFMKVVIKLGKQLQEVLLKAE